MSETKAYKLTKVAVEFNVSKDTLAEFLSSKGFKVDAKNLNAKIGEGEYNLLMKEFQGEKIAKQEAKHVGQITREKKESIVLDESKTTHKKKDEFEEDIVIKDMSATSKAIQSINEESKQRIARESAEKEKATEKAKPVDETIKAKSDNNINVKVVSKIDLASINSKTKPDKKSKKEEVTEEPKKGKKKAVAEEPVV